MKNRWLMLLLLAGMVITVDQVTKELVIANLALYESVEPIPALSDYFKITHSFNTGAAFGILPNASDLFLGMALLIVLTLLFFYGRIPPEGWVTRMGVSLIIGGALGNVLDRIRHDHVTDFIHYQIPDLFSNVSNLADHAIVLGVILIFIDSFRLERLERQRAATAQAEETTTPGSTEAGTEGQPLQSQQTGTQENPQNRG
ncbi:MAG: signal peptidase II [Chloroflexota bacterium]